MLYIIYKANISGERSSVLMMFPSSKQEFVLLHFAFHEYFCTNYIVITFLCFFTDVRNGNLHLVAFCSKKC